MFRKKWPAEAMIELLCRLGTLEIKPPIVDLPCSQDAAIRAPWRSTPYCH